MARLRRWIHAHEHRLVLSACLVGWLGIVAVAIYTVARNGVANAVLATINVLLIVCVVAALCWVLVSLTRVTCCSWEDAREEARLDRRAKQAAARITEVMR